MTALIAFATAIVTSGGLTWILKNWISTRLRESIRNEYEKERIQFEADLKTKNDTALEKFRSDLTIAAARRNIEYSRIHEKRLTVISEVFGRLVTLINTSSDYVSPLNNKPGSQQMSDRRNAADQSLLEFTKAFIPNRLFVPEETAKRIETLRQEIQSTLSRFMLTVELGGSEDEWLTAHSYIRDEATKLLAELEREFRSLLGG